jgi:glucose/mannose transport system substrate-binding protein
MTPDTNQEWTRRKYLTGAGAATAALLAGCSGDGGSDGGDGGSDGGDGGSDGTATGTEMSTSGGGNTLEVAHWWSEGDGNEAITSLMDGFREEHPEVDVNDNLVAGGAGQNLRDNIRTRIQNGNHPSTWQSWPGAELSPFVEADLLEDIEDSVWSENDMKSAYLEGPKQAAKPGGSFVTVPLNIHRLNNLFYNVEVVESAGVDPTSLDSPRALFRAMVTVDQETDAAPMANQTAAPWSTLQLWAQVLLGQSGGDTYSTFTDGNVGDVEAEVKDALTMVGQYKDYFTEDAGSISWTEGNSKVINGDAAFIHQGDWAAGAYRGQDGFEFESDWDHVPFPGTSGMYALNMDSFPYPTDNPSPEATKKFLRYVGSVDGQERFNPKKGSIPPRTDVPDDEFGPFLTRQKSDFADSDAQPPSITHGLGVSPEQLSNLKSAVSTFTSNWDVTQAYNQMENSF